MSNLTKEQAIALSESKWYEGKSAQEIVDFQLYEDKLCMPFNLYHEALERGVFTHEFVNTPLLRKEYENGKEI